MVFGKLTRHWSGHTGGNGPTELHRARLEDEARRIEHDDLMAELAGLSLKAYRVLSRSPEAKADLKRRTELAQSVLLHILIYNVAYRAAFERTMSAIDDARSRSNDILAGLTNALTESDERLADIRTRAATLPDGTAIYWTDDGRWRDDFGHDVSTDLSVARAKRDGRSSYAEYVEAHGERLELEDAYEDVVAFQDRLNAAEDSVTNHEAPLSIDEMQSVERRVSDDIQRLEAGFAKLAMSSSSSSEGPLSLDDLAAVTPLSGMKPKAVG